MKREFTNEEMFILDEKTFDITCAYSSIAVLRQAVIGGDIVNLKDASRVLFTAELQLSNALEEISKVMGTNYLEMQ